MRAERTPKLLVPPFADEMQVEVADRREEAVGLVHDFGAATGPRHAQAVQHNRGIGSLEGGAKDAVVLVVQFDLEAFAVFEAYKGHNLVGERFERANRVPALVFVQAEDRMRRIVRTGRD